MITETELREAMQHSAARADELIEQRESTAGRPQLIDLQVPSDRARAVRRRTWLPLTAGAAVAVVAGGGLMLAVRPAHHSPATPPAPAASAAPQKSAAAAPRTDLAITNLATIPGNSSYSLETGMETISPPMGGIQVMALPATRFDPTRRLTDPQPVSVAGARGYAGHALIYLIDPDDPQQASKAGAPRNTVAWPAGDGTWLVAQNFMAGGTDFTDVPIATLVHDAEQLGVRAAPAPLRSGYRVRWLPAGLTLTDVDGSVGNPGVGLMLTGGRKWISIEANSTAVVGLPTPDRASATKQIAGYSITVTGTGYDHATLQRVLDSLDISRLHGPQSGWWTLDQAVN